MRYSFLTISALAFAVTTCKKDDTSIEEGTPHATDRIIFRSEDGREVTANDLADATGTFKYEIMDTTEIPAKANELHQKARQLGAAGEYEQAIELLAQAQSLAPEWPYPVYDAAFTYLMMRDFEKAREFYKRTVDLSPRGFFTALTALDTLEREAAGDLPEGTYAAYVSLEWIDSPEQKAELVAALIERIPTFAPAWKEHALLCDDPSNRLASIEKGLAANPDAETKGILLINKAVTLDEQGDNQGAVEILGNLVLDPKTTFGNEHIAKQTLAMISEQGKNI